MRREWEPEDLIEHDERELVAYKRGATRLGFALMLKFFEIDARFPRHVGEYSPAAVDYGARQVGVDPGDLADYEWSGWCTRVAADPRSHGNIQRMVRRRGRAG